MSQGSAVGLRMWQSLLQPSHPWEGVDAAQRSPSQWVHWVLNNGITFSMVEKVARLFDTTNACSTWEHLGAVGWIFILGEVVSLELEESRLWLSM